MNVVIKTNRTYVFPLSDRNSMSVSLPECISQSKEEDLREIKEYLEFITRRIAKHLKKNSTTKTTKGE